jgi:hypothetical protein
VLPWIARVTLQVAVAGAPANVHVFAVADAPIRQGMMLRVFIPGTMLNSEQSVIGPLVTSKTMLEIPNWEFVAVARISEIWGSAR